jgi:hypothetical protein
MLRFVFLSLVTICSAAFAADDPVLVIEQDYNIIEGGKGGVQAKDERQKLYIHKDFVCIDEFGGADNLKPTETVLIDLKNRQIINLFHGTTEKVTVSFDERRKRIEKAKRIAREDLDAQPEGPQRDKMLKLYRALLDDERNFKLEQTPDDRKDLAGVVCQGVKITLADKADYMPAQMYLHPTLEMPYDNAEVLYLLQIIGEKLAGFLKANQATFRKVPMETHLELAAGGHLDTKVVSVAKTDRAKLGPDVRELGNPFEVPPDYKERAKKPPEMPNDERPD